MKQQSTPKTKSPQIILMEDDESILEVTTLILSSNGYEVIPVTDDADAMIKINSHPPDIILMDVWVPGHDVRDICQKLKNKESTKRIPIILFSATSGIEKIVTESGADDYIGKPFDMDELLIKIARHLKNTISNIKQT